MIRLYYLILFITVRFHLILHSFFYRVIDELSEILFLKIKQV